MSDKTFIQQKQPGESQKSGKKKPCLIMIQGDFLGEIYPLEKEAVIIGRSNDADIVIHDKGVSRRHCMLEKSSEKYRVSDLGSTNGTEVNGKVEFQKMIEDGDRIQLGSIVLKFCYQDEIDNRYHEKLRQMAIRDGLTRLYNKRHFNEVFEKEFHFASRNSSNLSVILFDIDHFKKTNDTYGHQAGDFVLKEIARVIETEIRGHDLLARYGGEEFVFLLRNVEYDEAIQFADRIRKLVESTKFMFEKSTIPTTISMGVATVSAGLHFDSENAMLESADQYLYKAKDAGRNQVGNLAEK